MYQEKVVEIITSNIDDITDEMTFACTNGDDLTPKNNETI